MPHYLNRKIWLVGAGPMALDYAAVLKAQEIPFEVIGRGFESAAAFKEKTGVDVCTGGLKPFLEKTEELPFAAIVAVGVEQLAEATVLLLRKGIKHILAEKPAGLNAEEIRKVADEARAQKASVYVAYNRRFYASTMKAREIIAEDGGVLSFSFEFTEWSHIIEGLNKAPGVKENWFLANSTHVVDLAFYLGGKPKEISCYTSGGLHWHPIASVFAGAGRTEEGALFSYQANWEAPGRWGVEILTRRHRLIFRPMEQLYIQRIGTVSIDMVPLNDELDLKFKPGLYCQVESFLNKNTEGLMDILNQNKILKYYELMTNARGATNEKQFLRLAEE